MSSPRPTFEIHLDTSGATNVLPAPTSDAFARFGAADAATAETSTASATASETAAIVLRLMRYYPPLSFPDDKLPVPVAGDQRRDETTTVGRVIGPSHCCNRIVTRSLRDSVFVSNW